MLINAPSVTDLTMIYQSLRTYPGNEQSQLKPEDFAFNLRYEQAMPESKREANGKVVTMVLKPLRASA